ncbi:MAG: hypothetical protein QOI35_1102 [Cryptosporangiaceae bacterium]|jgi:hypothetical protein|nr:hypothetical protein [Cryptosporangiaceae bacterium]MDQ1656645.1 hypothetical protein [Cryptosporangiaceae bacterium]
MRDELLQPTVPAVDPSRPPPWRQSSQAYVAFFGGTLAATVIAVANSGRLGASPRQRAAILGTGLAVLALAVPLVLWSVRSDSGISLRLLTRIPAVAAYAIQARIVRPLDRAFSLRGGERASLWAPGLATVVGCGLVETFLFVLVVGYAR